jgi:DNA/RNA endonuclease YhcR with UshA esterase domain
MLQTGLHKLISNSATPISYTDAEQFVGQFNKVTGEIQFIFNNGKAVYLGFQNPHQGAFKVRIMKDDWNQFHEQPERLFQIGQQITVSGIISWYQGDPIIYVREPSQIK